MKTAYIPTWATIQIKVFEEFQSEVSPHCAVCGRCCSRCHDQIGYLYNTNLSETQIQKIKSIYGWTQKRGFLGNLGCKIPREFRSWVCRAFLCTDPDRIPQKLYTKIKMKLEQERKP